MPLTYPLAVANIRSRPRMTKAKVKADVAEVAAAAQGGIIGWSEISHPDYVTAVGELDGFTTYQPDGVDVPISWDTTRFTPTDVGCDFGNRAVPGIAPARHSTWGLLEDRAMTKRTVGVLNVHMIPDGWNPKHVVQRVLRRLLWSRHEKRILRRATWLAHRAHAVHLMGDINRPESFTFLGFRRSSGPGVLYVGSRGAVAQSEAQHVRLYSDHAAQVVTITPRIGGAMPKHIEPPAPKYLGPAAHTSPGHNRPIRRIVIHCTVSPCEPGGARKTAAYFRSQQAGGSAHYVHDPDESVQVVFDDVIAWHAPPNPHSIGHELCDALVSREWDLAHADRWFDDSHQKMLKRAARIVARQCLAEGVPIVRLSVADLEAGRRGICGHDDVSEAFGQSSHWDPGPSFPWDHFMALVNDAAHKIKENHR